MDLSKVPGWLLAVGVFLIAIGFIVSLYALDEPRTFAGLSFGPIKSKNDEDIIKQIDEINSKISAELEALKSQFQSEVKAVQNKVSNIKLNIDGRELPSTGGNAKSSVCPDNSYMIGVRMQSDSGGPHGIVSTVIPVCRTLEISAK